jgi:hypothetical protein
MTNSQADLFVDEKSERRIQTPINLHQAAKVFRQLYPNEKRFTDLQITERSRGRIVEKKMIYSIKVRTRDADGNNTGGWVFDRTDYISIVAPDIIIKPLFQKRRCKTAASPVVNETTNTIAVTTESPVEAPPKPSRYLRAYIQQFGNAVVFRVEEQNFRAADVKLTERAKIYDRSDIAVDAIQLRGYETIYDFSTSEMIFNTIELAHDYLHNIIDWLGEFVEANDNRIPAIDDLVEGDKVDVYTASGDEASKTVFYKKETDPRIVNKYVVIDPWSLNDYRDGKSFYTLGVFENYIKPVLANANSQWSYNTETGIFEAKF